MLTIFSLGELFHMSLYFENSKLKKLLNYKHFNACIKAIMVHNKDLNTALNLQT